MAMTVEKTLELDRECKSRSLAETSRLVEQELIRPSPNNFPSNSLRRGTHLVSVSSLVEEREKWTRSEAGPQTYAISAPHKQKL